MSLDQLIGFIKVKDLTGLTTHLRSSHVKTKEDLGVALLYACTIQQDTKTGPEHPALVKALLDAGAPIEYSIDPSDALKYVPTFGDASFVLTQKATPLSLAVRWQVNPDVVKLLVDSGANVLARTTTGQSPLHLVAMHTSTDGLAALDIIIAKYQSERAKGNQLAHIDMKDASSMTPAMWAARLNLEGLKKLVNAGASITESAFNKTTLGLTLRSDIEAYITEVIVQQHGEDALYKGIGPDTTRAIRPELWNLVDKVTTQGTQKLVAALEMLRAKGLLKEALEYKLVHDTAKCAGQTILHHAAEVGSVEMVEVLVKYGADTSARDGVKNIIPVLQSFSAESDPRTAAYLVVTTSHEALSALYGNPGREFSLLHIAANKPGLIKTLLTLAPGKFNVDIQAGKAFAGNTALHIAAENLLFEDVEALIAAGAKTDIRNDGGNTALDRITGDTFYSQYPEMIPAGNTITKIDHKKGQEMMVKLLKHGAHAWTTDLSPKTKDLAEYPVTELFKPYLIEVILNSGNIELIDDCLRRLDYQGLDIYKMTCGYGTDKGMLLLHKMTLNDDTTALKHVLDHLQSKGKLKLALEYATVGVNADHDGEQLLYVASKYGSAAAVKMLVNDYKANPNLKHATKGAIPLAGALISNSDEVVEFLLSRTTPALLTEKYGPAKNLSLLFYAASAVKSSRAIELVLQKMPKDSYNPNETVNIGGTDHTYLELALNKGQTGNAVALINAGAVVDFISQDGQGHNAIDRALAHYMEVLQKGILPLVAQMQQADATIQKQQTTIDRYLPNKDQLKEAEQKQLEVLQTQLATNKTVLLMMDKDLRNATQEMNKDKATVKAFLQCGGEFVFFSNKGEVSQFVAEMFKEELASLPEELKQYAVMLLPWPLNVGIIMQYKLLVV